MARNTTKTKLKAVAAELVAYKDHQAGSRKGQVHKVFDEKGADAARKLGEELGLAATTLTSWFSGWSKKAAKPEPKAGVTTKAKPKQAAAANKRATFKRSRR